MKRFHVHVCVRDLSSNIAFYTKLFGAGPGVLKNDYAKWMLEDPRLNFAISSRDGEPGVNHLGFQLDTAEDLAALREQAERADLAAVDEPGAACCYARSDKHWITDPQGLAWEVFRSLGSIPVYGEPDEQREERNACCAPKAAEPAASTKSACCG